MIKQVVLSGKVVAGTQFAIKASPSEGVDRLVLTASPKTVGSVVAPGELVAAVSGRPLLMLPSSVPLYRDIELGDSGPDVAALQPLWRVSATHFLDGYLRHWPRNMP